jgi:Flp pilus assembly protein TadD
MRSPTYWEARHLLAHALRRAGRTTEAAQHLTTLLPEALHPYRLHSELAEWAHADGLSDAALTHLAEAIAAAPPHRRGRLRTRRAALLRQAGRTTEADAELAAIPDEDPGWCRH